MQLVQEYSEAKYKNKKKRPFPAPKEEKRVKVSDKSWIQIYKQCAKAAAQVSLKSFNQSVKVIQNRARKISRDCALYWKKNEKEEKESKKRHEKEAVEKEKQIVQDREEKRAKRKLEFLIKQTELYALFSKNKQVNEDTEGEEVETAKNAFFKNQENLKKFNTVQVKGEKIAQPKYVMYDLKEYQLQGVSWLLSLYEQGINGILVY